jgi:hypothetical protein
MFRTVAAKKDSASVPSVSLTDPAAHHSSDDIGPLVQSTNASTSKNNVILEDAELKNSHHQCCHCHRRFIIYIVFHKIPWIEFPL